MEHIRNEFDEFQARRWPAELPQSAQDLSIPGRPVRVRIELTDHAVRFLHSGRPFSVKDILSVINQVSSQKPGEGVGRYGTGFLSTFQLSMQVEVRSYLKEDGEPFRAFRICLDRSGTTQKVISAAIQQAMETLAGLIQNGLQENASRLSEDLPDFDPESGIFFGEDWSDTRGEARRERLRRIGEAGERCAFQAVADYFTNRGFAMELEDGGLVQLSGEDTRVTIRRADTEEYRQPGWDIDVCRPDRPLDPGFSLFRCSAWHSHCK